MIRFNLHCDNNHDFEAWFSSGEDFNRQSAADLLSCAYCGSQHVSKTVMAPAVTTKRTEETSKPILTPGPAHAAMMDKLKEIVRDVRANSEDVGDRFPEEARKIHYGESAPRGIIGSASGADVHALIDEGVSIMPLPVLPEDAN